MPSPELENYIKQQTINGYSREQIINALVASGWNSDEVNQAVNGVPYAPNSDQVLSKTKPQRTFGLLVTAAIFLVLLAGSGAYAAYMHYKPSTVAYSNALPSGTVTTTTPLVVPSSLPTSSLLLYTSPKYGYSFKYPSNWKVSTMGNLATVASPDTQNTDEYKNIGLGDVAISRVQLSSCSAVYPGVKVTGCPSPETPDQQAKDLVIQIGPIKSLTVIGIPSYAAAKIDSGFSSLNIAIPTSVDIVFLQFFNVSAIKDLNQGQKSVLASLALSQR